MHLRLELCIGGLGTQGFVVEEGQCLRQQQQDARAPADARAAELMHCLLRDDIAAIIPPWGGELAIELDRLRDRSRCHLFADRADALALPPTAASLV